MRAVTIAVVSAVLLALIAPLAVAQDGNGGVRRQSNRDHGARFVRDALQPVGCFTLLVGSSVSVV